MVATREKIDGLEGGRPLTDGQLIVVLFERRPRRGWRPPGPAHQDLGRRGEGGGGHDPVRE